MKPMSIERGLLAVALAATMFAGTATAGFIAPTGLAPGSWGGESREKTGGRLDANSVPGAGVAFRSNYLSLNGLDTASTAGLEDSETEYADPRIDALLSPTHQNTKMAESKNTDFFECIKYLP